MTSTSLKINRFDPRTMEARRVGGNPSTCIFIGKRGTGKCLSPEEKVLFYEGRVEIAKNVKVGDLLMGDDSKPRRVLNISQGESIMYKVKQTKGDDYIVNENHVLSLKDVNADKDIDIAIKDYMALDNKANLKGFKVGVEFPEKKLPLDPYILGLWLGDGSSDNTKDSTIIKKLGLVGNKHIPFDYKVNSRKNRLLLLAGLLDTYNHLDEDEIIQKNKVLAQDTQFLCRSLGFECEMKDDNGMYYRINIRGDKVPWYKRNNKHDKNPLIANIEIENIGVGEYYGFEVDSNHRFLLGDFTVTHNSTLISDIMYYHKSVPYGLIMSGTEEGNGYYGKYFPNLFIHNGFKKELVATLIARQKKVLKDKSRNPHSFLLLDDCMYDKGLTKDKNMRLIFMNGRHWKILFMLSMQYCMDLPPALRANVDYLFLMRENIIDNQKKLWKYFFGMFPTFQSFQQTFMACTEEFECLVLDNTSRSNKIEDCVFWYKAKPDRIYRIGCPQIWDYAKKHYNSNHDSEDTSPAKIVDKKKCSMIIKKQGIKENKRK